MTGETLVAPVMDMWEVVWHRGTMVTDTSQQKNHANAILVEGNGDIKKTRT